MTPSFLLVLVPLLPLLAALATVIGGQRLGPRAHLPAVVGIASAAVVGWSLLVITATSIAPPTPLSAILRLCACMVVLYLHLSNERQSKDLPVM